MHLPWLGLRQFGQSGDVLPAVMASIRLTFPPAATSRPKQDRSMISEFDLMVDYGQILIDLSTVARPGLLWDADQPRHAGLRLSAGHRQLRHCPTMTVIALCRSTPPPKSPSRRTPSGRSSCRSTSQSARQRLAPSSASATLPFLSETTLRYSRSPKETRSNGRPTRNMPTSSGCISTQTRIRVSGYSKGGEVATDTVAMKEALQAQPLLHTIDGRGRGGRRRSFCSQLDLVKLEIGCPRPH